MGHFHVLPLQAPSLSTQVTFLVINRHLEYFRHAPRPIMFPIVLFCRYILLPQAISPLYLLSFLHLEVCFYKAQYRYPVCLTAQMALHFTTLADLFILTPMRLLWEAFSHDEIPGKDYSLTFSPLSIARYSLIQLSELGWQGDVYAFYYYYSTIRFFVTMYYFCMEIHLLFLHKTRRRHAIDARDAHCSGPKWHQFSSHM